MCVHCALCIQVLCAVADVADCGATYQITYTDNCAYISYMKYLIQVGAELECVKNANKVARETITKCFYSGRC